MYYFRSEINALIFIKMNRHQWIMKRFRIIHLYLENDVNDSWLHLGKSSLYSHLWALPWRYFVLISFYSFRSETNVLIFIKMNRQQWIMKRFWIIHFYLENDDNDSWLHFGKSSLNSHLWALPWRVFCANFILFFSKRNKCLSIY